MAMSGELHALATVFAGKSPCCPLDRSLRGPQHVWNWWFGEKPLFKLGIELLLSSSQQTITLLTQLHKKIFI
jgi:hypothetical protein